MAGEPALYATPTGTEGTGQAATLLLQVWPAEAVALRSNGAPPWIVMLRQVIVSSGGTLSGSDGDEGRLPAASFPSVASAVRAGRRLQALVTGYAVESKGQLFGVAVLIHPNSATDTAALRCCLQQKTCPAQMLLATTRGTVSPDGGRRIEDALIGELAVYEISYAHSEEAARAAETLLREHQDRHIVSQRVPALPAAKPSASSLVFARMYARPRNVAAAVAATIVLAAGVAIARRPAKRPQPVVAPVVQPSIVIQRQPVPASVENMPAVAPFPKAGHAKKPAPALESPHTAEKPARGRGDLTSEQIRQILARGQNALDRGCYTEAVHYYRRVLDDDPRNGSATGGMEKARVRMRLSAENAQCSR